MFGGPGWGWFGGDHQLQGHRPTTSTRSSRSSTSARRIDYLIDQPGIIKGIYKGAAVHGLRPGAVRADVAVRAGRRRPPRRTRTARRRRSRCSRPTAGRSCPTGRRPARRPGTGADECGAGIPAGTPLEVRLGQPARRRRRPTGALESEAFASEAKQAAGINIEPADQDVQLPDLQLQRRRTRPPPSTPTTGASTTTAACSPTTTRRTDGVFNTGGGFNLGDYNDSHGQRADPRLGVRRRPDGGEERGVVPDARACRCCSCPTQDYLLAVNTKKVGGPADGWTVDDPAAVVPAVLVPGQGLGGRPSHRDDARAPSTVRRRRVRRVVRGCRRS